MSYNNYTPNTQLTHKQIILQQVLICNKLFSGYEASPTTINPLAGFYDFTPQAHTGKSILLGVLTLEANARSILPEEYQKRTDPIKQKIFQTVDLTYKDAKGSDENYTGLAIIAPDPAIQLQAILEVYLLYQEILAAIYSLPRFSDAIPRHQILTKETITELDLMPGAKVEFDLNEKETISEQE